MVDACDGCGFVQVREQPREQDLVEMYGASYFDRGKYSDPFAQRKENERRLSLLKSCDLPAGARVLDAGCATGGFISAARSCFDMWGLDISEFAVEEARRANPSVSHQIHAALAEKQMFPADHFDAIVLWDVLEHLWDPVETCRLMLESLKPGGCFILSTPNIGALTAKLMGRRWAFMTVPEHLGFFSRPTMTYLLEQRLGLQCRVWRTRGKWANLGFLTYKLKRVFPRMVPAWTVRLMRVWPLGRLALYVPTLDIQYAAARKP
jgi:2-polyprenyl-3-methyl-5-hydroxy-6-metoxy-1,4-benzoquinol methylase